MGYFSLLSSPLTITEFRTDCVFIYLVFFSLFRVALLFRSFIVVGRMYDSFPQAHLTHRHHLLDVLVVYTTCPVTSANDLFPAWKFRIPTFNIKCDPLKVRQSCREAVGYLNFVISNYDYPPAKRYIFVHGHETSWHYPRSIFREVERIINTEYWRQNTYGAVYPHLIGPWCAETQTWAVPFYKYLYHGTSMPTEAPVSGTRWPCCGTFWVNSLQTRVRRKDEYILIRDRLIEWSLQVNNPRHEPVNRTLGIVQHFPQMSGSRSSAGWYCSRIAEFTWALLLANISIVKQPPVFTHR
jgi:hypothetical protein